MGIRELFLERCDTPHNIDKHLPTLLGYGSMVDSVVELGTDIGFSTTAWLAAGVREVDCYDINITDWARRLEQMAIGSHTFIRLHQESSLSAVVHECDLLFIDTIHTYRQVSMELLRHGDKAKRFIICHDTLSNPVIVPAITDWLFKHPAWGAREWSMMQSGLVVLEKRCG